MYKSSLRNSQIYATSCLEITTSIKGVPTALVRSHWFLNIIRLNEQANCKNQWFRHLQNLLQYITKYPIKPFHMGYHSTRVVSDIFGINFINSTSTDKHFTESCSQAANNQFLMKPAHALMNKFKKNGLSMTWDLHNQNITTQCITMS